MWRWSTWAMVDATTLPRHRQPPQELIPRLPHEALIRHRRRHPRLVRIRQDVRPGAMRRLVVDELEQVRRHPDPSPADGGNVLVQEQRPGVHEYIGPRSKDVLAHIGLDL